MFQKARFQIGQEVLKEKLSKWVSSLPKRFFHLNGIAILEKENLQEVSSNTISDYILIPICEKYTQLGN